ncbi:preprotein translocase subunit SecG [Henriciella sp.]|uniref:preprotein translocase subunit SecG n=1 Tax=Henriciella sp. TaxID=1968823 RepID=UPI002615C5ED|nr:preprotein translocase subunit SecG [Henriciella sp.]
MTVILVIHILVSVVLVGVVLMQRSEGGALGVGGGGGGGGGLMSGRGAAGALVRTTIIFGAMFFVTSLVLTTITSRGSDGLTEIERQLDEESGGGADPLDVVNDPTSPLFNDEDTGSAEMSAPSQPQTPEAETQAPAGTGTESSDPLAADVVPQDDEGEQAVDEPQQ